ncbi:MAG: DUF2164 domain-containing protein [Bacillota bacterium]|nr:DUF2164 domain-containing protein [Bacillota bacterium]
MKKNNKNKIELSNEVRQNMVEKVKYYFQNERDEELGDLAAGLILDFIIDELSPEFYNKGVYDSYKYMNERTEDLLGIQK